MHTFSGNWGFHKPKGTPHKSEGPPRFEAAHGLTVGDGTGLFLIHIIHPNLE